MQLNEGLQLFILIASIIGILFKVFQVKTEIDNKIFSQDRQLNERIKNLENQFNLHQQDYISRKDAVNMLINQTNEKIDHKFGRAFKSIRDIQGYLKKKGEFIIREYYRGSDDETGEL